LATIDIDVHKALRWQQFLGAYSRLGWRHPGPVHAYLISFVARLVGQSHGSQAQQMAAITIDGLAVAGVVVLIGRMGGARRAAAAAIASAGVVAGLGVMSDPWIAWGPSVVVLPLVLLGVLAVAAARGSVTALAGCFLVGTFAVQTELGTLLLVGVLIAGGGAMCMFTRSRDGRGRQKSLTPGAVVLIAATIACWVPVVYQQATGSPGNAASLVRFFAHSHEHAGSPGVATAGASFVRVVGVHPFPALRPGIVGFFRSMSLPDRTVGFLELAVSAVAALGLLAAARRARDSLATALAVVFAVGIPVLVLSGAAIVGPPFAWLLWPAAAPAAAGVMAAALLVERLRPLQSAAAVRASCLAALVALGALTTWAAVLPRIGPPANTQVAAGWKAMEPLVVDSGRQAIGLSASRLADPTVSGMLAWVADELDVRHIPFTIPRQWQYRFGPGHSGPPPSRWIRVDDPTEPLPAEYRAVATVDGLRYSYGTTPPP
jgi:hypothetical protein